MTDLTDDEVARIAEGLTQAQREYLMGHYNPRLTGGKLGRLWRNLRRRGLSDSPHSGLNKTGLRVRAHLEQATIAGRG